jgi:WD40 repeat protein
LVTIWNSETEQEQVSLFQLAYDIWSVAFNTDGTWLAASSNEGRVWIWDATTGQEIYSFSNSELPITDITFGPNDKFLATTSQDGIITIWDVRPNSGYELFSIGQDIVSSPEGAFSISLSPDGRSLFAIDSSGVSHLWDAETGELIKHIESQMDLVEKVMHRPTGETIGIFSQDGVFKLLDADTDEEELHISGLYGCCFAFHPNGDLVAITTKNRSITVFNIEDLPGDAGQPINTPISEKILDITYIAEGSTLAILGENDFLKLLHVESGESQRIYLSNISSFAGQHNGSLLAIAFQDGSIGLFNSENGEQILSLPGHTAFVNEVLFSNDDEILVSASRDGIVKIWDVSTGKELLSLFVHPLGVFDIALSPDGKRLYAAAADGTIRAYLLDIEELIALAYNRLTRWFTPEECQTYLHTDTCPPPP